MEQWVSIFYLQKVSLFVRLRSYVGSIWKICKGVTLWKKSFVLFFKISSIESWWRLIYNVCQLQFFTHHYCDFIIGTIAYRITSLTVVYSAVYSDAVHRKHQSSALLAFVWGIHQGPVNSPHKWPVTRKCFHLMTSSWMSIQWKYPFALIPLLMLWLLQIFVHAITVCSVKICAEIWCDLIIVNWIKMEQHFSSFEYQRKYFTKRAKVSV